jgi:DNA polymerase sigma
MQDALEAVRSALVKRWPDCKVHLFGSTANQLSICDNNDIDVCLELPDLPSDAVRSQQQTWSCVWRVTCICSVMTLGAAHSCQCWNTPAAERRSSENLRVSKI